jgi:hypothetical protein
MKRAQRSWLGALAVAALWSGCHDPKEFSLSSVPPPGKLGTLDQHAIRLSKGVALAITCRDPEDSVGTCGRLRARASNPGIARAFAVDSDNLVSSWAPGRSTQRQTTFVITGVAAGRAQVDIETANTLEAFDVTVVE